RAIGQRSPPRRPKPAGWASPRTSSMIRSPVTRAQPAAGWSPSWRRLRATGWWRWWRGGGRHVGGVAGGAGDARHPPRRRARAAPGIEGRPWALLAAGTDGIDGSGDAAGACVDGGTVIRARAQGLDPSAALAATDSGPLLAATGDLVCTGPTGTNVADLVVALRPAGQARTTAAPPQL